MRMALGEVLVGVGRLERTRRWRPGEEELERAGPRSRPARGTAVPRWNPRCNSTIRDRLIAERRLIYALEKIACSHTKDR